MSSDTEIFDSKVARLCIWCGPGYVGLWLVGFYLAGMLPPISAADTAQQTSDFYLNNLSGARLGSFIMIVTGTLFLPWGIVLAGLLRRAEKGVPLLFYIQIASVAFCACDIMFIGNFFGMAAYRTGEAGPEIIQTWNDVAWFGVLYTWPPFSIWCIAIAMAILNDKSEKPCFPRWVAYLNYWAALLYVPAGGMLFFKEGPFSQSGVITFWVPMVTYFTWISTMSYQMFRSLNAQKQEQGLKSRTAVTA